VRTHSVIPPRALLFKVRGALGAGGNPIPITPSFPRALLSKVPKYVSSIRGALLRGALGEGGNPFLVVHLSQRCRVVVAYLFPYHPRGRCKFVR